MWPNFICEACTVRAVLLRELTGHDDWKLLCFERMRILDMAHYWASGTLAAYGSKLRILATFESHFDNLSIFRPTPLAPPPEVLKFLLCGAKKLIASAPEVLGARMIPSTKSSSLFRPFAPSGLPSGSITHGT